MATRRLPDPALLMRLRTRQLLLVAQLGEVGHLGRAAAALGVSQPAATKLLQQTEEVLGQPLFTRLARGMQPTPAGDALIRFAQQLLTDFGSVRDEMQALRSGQRGVLRIGSVPGALPELVAPALEAWQRGSPRVAVSVVVDTSDRMLEQLARAEVDLVLGRLSEGVHDDEFDAHELLVEAQVVVLRRQHPLLGTGPSPTLRELARQPWILQPPGSPQRSRLEATLREAGIHVRLDITETASTVATTALLEVSDRLAVMPASLARHYARLGVLAVLPFELPLVVPSVHLILRRGRTPSPAARSFIEHLLGGAQRVADGAGPDDAGNVSDRVSRSRVRR
jgi:DNA-binding transcriptional LysR family regulator